MTHNKFIKYYFLPFLIITIALFQFFQVKENGLTKWKGGGFGMYSEHHFSFNQIWINKVDLLKSKDKKINLLASQLKKIPSNINAKNLIKALDLQKDTILLELWKPKYVVSSSKYSRELIYEIVYYKNKGNE